MVCAHVRRDHPRALARFSINLTTKSFGRHGSQGMRKTGTRRCTHGNGRVERMWMRRYDAAWTS